MLPSFFWRFTAVPLRDGRASSRGGVRRKKTCWCWRGSATTYRHPPLGGLGPRPRPAADSFAEMAEASRQFNLRVPRANGEGKRGSRRWITGDVGPEYLSQQPNNGGGRKRERLFWTRSKSSAGEPRVCCTCFRPGAHTERVNAGASPSSRGIRRRGRGRAEPPRPVMVRLRLAEPSRHQQRVSSNWAPRAPTPGLVS